MEIIGIQTDIAWEERDTNYARVRELLSGSRISPGSLLVLPELFAVGFSMDSAKVADRRRETEIFLMDLARQYQSFVIGGVASHVPGESGDSMANESLLVDPEGNLVERYQKMHPFSLAGEPEHYHAGNAVVVAECGEFLVAPTICYDLRFPELYRAAVGQGAEILVVIANWPVTRIDHWTTLLRARAIENQAYVIGVNRVGQDPLYTYNGKSLIVDPHGKVLAEAGASAGLIRAMADRRVLLDWRAAFPALQDRREDLGNGAVGEGQNDEAGEEPAANSLPEWVSEVSVWHNRA